MFPVKRSFPKSATKGCHLKHRAGKLIAIYYHLSNLHPFRIRYVTCKSNEREYLLKFPIPRQVCSIIPHCFVRSKPSEFKTESDRITSYFPDKRFVDQSQRVVNPPSLVVNDPRGGISTPSMDDARSTKSKKNAYRRSDSSQSGGSRSRSATKELHLPPDDALMCAPSFVTGLNPELEAEDGKFLELRCQVKGDPAPQVNWTKDGKTLTSSPDLEVKYKNGVSTVTIKEVFPEDAGRYACKATNTKGAVETSCKVNVKAVPKAKVNGKVNGASALTCPNIHSHTTSSVVKDGEAVTLECTIAAEGRFDVVWLHNEKEIKPNKDFAYKTVGNKHILEINEIFPEDSGTYTCEAFNDVGECYSTCTLEVAVPGEELTGPQFKSYPKSVTTVRNGSASFATETVGVAKHISWMKDGKELKEIPLKIKIGVEKNKLTLDVMDCSPADAGQYAVIVENDKGESKAAFSLNVNI